MLGFLGIMSGWELDLVLLSMFDGYNENEKAWCRCTPGLDAQNLDYNTHDIL